MPKLSFLTNSGGAQRSSEHFRQSLEVFEKSSKSSKVTRIFSEIPLMTQGKNLAFDPKKVDRYNSCFKLCNHVKGLNPGAISSVQNIPKFKDRANWSCDTFQPMRRRACVYQQTNQNIAPVIKHFQNNGRSRTELKMSLQYSSRFHI